MGNVNFTDFKLADNFRAGFQAHLSNFTKEEVIFKDSIVIGRSNGNGESIEFHEKAGSCGIITTRTDGFRASKIDLFNFERGTFQVESSSDN